MECFERKTGGAGPKKYSNTPPVITKHESIMRIMIIIIAPLVKGFDSFRRKNEFCL
jgi:hypothetical protein